MRPSLFLSVCALAAGALSVTAAPATAAPCTQVHFVDARGTLEPGTLGIIVGDPVYSALQRRLFGRSTSAYAVDYPADLSSGSAGVGNTDLVEHLESQAASCPDQRFVLGGYSQGANVVDNSIGVSSAGAAVGAPITRTIPASIEPKVKAVLLFGNPIRAIGRRVTGTYAARTLDICAVGDVVCGGGISTIAHLTYGIYADQAAAFAASRL